MILSFRSHDSSGFEEGMGLKRIISRSCKVIGLLLLVGFAVQIVIDFNKYTNTLTSAPFYVWVLRDALYLGLPALMLFIAGIALKKKG